MGAGGRPPKFESSKQLVDDFIKWKEEMKTSEDIPDIEGFCDYLGVWRDLLCEYEKKPEFSDTIKKIKNWIFYRKKQLAMQGKMPPVVFIFDAKNNFNYKDKTETDVNLNKSIGDILTETE